MKLQWLPETAMVVERWGTIGYLVAGLLLLLPCFLREASTMRWFVVLQVTLLLYLFGWTLAIAAAGTINGGEFMSQWMLAEHATRIIVPLALLVMLPFRGRVAVASWRIGSGEWLLRLAVACTFFAHGYLALNHAGDFVDLILLTSMNLKEFVPEAADWLGKVFTQSHAETAMTVIGLIDMLVAAALLVVRSRSIAVYMVIWGSITAVSRVTAYGWEKYPDTFLRAANAGIPLALLLYWHFGRRLRAKANDDNDRDRKRTHEE